MHDKKFQKSIGRRFIFISLLFGFFAVVILSRLFYIGIIRHEYYRGVAEDQHRLSEILPSKRGKIFFQDKFGNQKVAAFSEDVYDVVVSPDIIEDIDGTASLFSDFFGKPKELYRAHLEKPDDKYEIIEKAVPSERTDELGKLGIPGLTLIPGSKRLYPGKELAAHVLGYVGFQGEGSAGLYGVERYYDGELRGLAGSLEGEKSATGYWLAIGKRIISDPVNGSDVILTIDHNIQKKAEDELKLAIEKWSAESGSVLVLEPKTGRILSLAAYPVFDPNEYFKEKDYSVFKNPIVESLFELGSVFKPVTMAMAINENLVNPRTVYTDTGEVRIGGYTIKNFDEKKNGVQTMTQVLEKSLNTGAVFVGTLLGKERFKRYVADFGFGEKTGIDLPGELFGNVSNLRYMRDIDFATASFGQGVGITPLQLAMAIAAIANGGLLMRPYVVESIRNENGTVYEVAPETVRKVLNPDTAEALSIMLVSVVKNGYEGRAGVDGYLVAAKTGTAQIPSPDSRGYSADVIHSFVGYAPAFDPKFLIYMQLNKPTGNRFAANTLTVPFHNMIQYLLNYYEIPPGQQSSHSPPQ